MNLKVATLAAVACQAAAVKDDMVESLGYRVEGLGQPCGMLDSNK